MKLIVGLGNPGEKYNNTRHNLGFMVVERFLKDITALNDTVWSDEKKLKSELAFVNWQGKNSKTERLILAKPQTYMNHSGMAVALIASYYNIPVEDIWVVYDDLDLPVGTMKIRFGGAAGGHHGVESILASLTTDTFWRFRFGIGFSRGHIQDSDGGEMTQNRRTIGKVEDYVLSEFASHDHNKVRTMIENGSEALQLSLEQGMDKAMNRFNTR